MVYKTIIICIGLLLVYCSIGVAVKGENLLTERSKISVEKARELKSVFCKTQIVGKEENYRNNPEVVDSFYVFPGSFFILKNSAINNGIWVNMYSGTVYNGKANAKKGNGWEHNKECVGE